MALNGPIIVVEDDVNDAEVIVAAIKEIGIPNEAKVMSTAREAYDYLCSTKDQPMLILCDIRMPEVNGLAFRKRITESEYLRRKSIPFIFLSALASLEIVNEAYDMDVQGFYKKAGTYDAVRDQLLTIFMYWKACLHPNREALT